MRAAFLNIWGLAFVAIALTCGDAPEQLIIWQACMVCGVMAMCTGQIVSAIKEGSHA